MTRFKMTPLLFWRICSPMIRTDQRCPSQGVKGGHVLNLSTIRCWPGTDRWRMLSPNGHLLPAMLNVKQIADNLQIEIRYLKKFWKCSTISYLWEEHGRCTLLYWEIGIEARPTRNEKTAPKFSTQKNKKWRGIEGKGFYDTIVRWGL